MSNWEEKTKHLGQIKPNKTIQVKFKSKFPLSIDSVIPGCTSCTKFIDYKDNVLTLNFTPSSPKHLSTKLLPITKSVTVYYEDGTSEELKFTATLNRY